MDHPSTDNARPGAGRFSAILSLLLVFTLAAFVLGFAVKVGDQFAAALAPDVADAAPEHTAAPEVTVTPEATVVSEGASGEEAAPPTSTPVPPSPTATLSPTPVPPTPTPAPPRLVNGDHNLNVRHGPGTGYHKIGQLAPGAESEITGRHGDWWRIRYEGQTAYVSGAYVTAYDVMDVPEVPVSELPGPTLDHPVFEPADPATINEARWIDVDLSEQRVTAYEGQTPVQSYLVSTGLPATPTPVGQFRIWVKFRYDDMEGEDYFLEDVPWVMYFHAGFGFHGVWWHANWGHPMSHGCINQPNEMAEWLFNFAEVGTLVNIHE
jgi:hypothetical protein